MDEGTWAARDPASQRVGLAGSGTRNASIARRGGPAAQTDPCCHPPVSSRTTRKMLTGDHRAPYITP